MSEIHEAAIAGDIAGLRRLLDRGAVNIRISGGRTLTMTGDGESYITDHQACSFLDLETLTWHPDP